MKPDKHYRQHHDVAAPQIDAKAFRQGWRVSTRLDGLLRDGEIDRGTWQIAVDFRFTWEIAFGLGLCVFNEMPGSRYTGFDGYTAERLDAVQRVREVKRLIGIRRVWLIERCILHDYPWQRTAAMLEISDKTARAWTAEALRELRRRCVSSESALPVVV